MLTTLPTRSRVDPLYEVVEIEIDIVDPRPELARIVVAKVLGIEMLQVTARSDEGPAGLRHLLAADGEKSMAEHRGGRTEARSHQHRGPEQSVKVGDVLADEVIQLGSGFRSPVLVELELRATGAEIRETRHVPDWGIEPNVEELPPERPEFQNRSKGRRARCPSREAPLRTTRRACWRSPAAPRRHGRMYRSIRAGALRTPTAGRSNAPNRAPPEPAPILPRPDRRDPSGNRSRRTSRNCRRTGPSIRNADRCRARTGREETSPLRDRRPDGWCARRSRLTSPGRGRCTRSSSGSRPSGWCRNCPAKWRTRRSRAGAPPTCRRSALRE